MVPPKHPKMIIFSRKTHGGWVPQFQETPIWSPSPSTQVTTQPKITPVASKPRSRSPCILQRSRRLKFNGEGPIDGFGSKPFWLPMIWGSMGETWCVELSSIFRKNFLLNRKIKLVTYSTYQPTPSSILRIDFCWSISTFLDVLRTKRPWRCSFRLPYPSCFLPRSNQKLVHCWAPWRDRCVPHSI